MRLDDVEKVVAEFPEDQQQAIRDGFKKSAREAKQAEAKSRLLAMESIERADGNACYGKLSERQIQLLEEIGAHWQASSEFLRLAPAEGSVMPAVLALSLACQNPRSIAMTVLMDADGHTGTALAGLLACGAGRLATLTAEIARKAQAETTAPAEAT